MQATFDFIVNHLRKQGRRAVNAKGRRCYRTEDGRSCAAGCLIPDEKYSPGFEGSAVVVRGGFHLRPQIPVNQEISRQREENGSPYLTEVGRILADEGHSMHVVAALQYIHDSKAPSHWEGKFKEVASFYGLQYQCA
jgi:hypothetical protein